MFMYWSPWPAFELRAEEDAIERGWFDSLMGKDHWMWEHASDLNFCKVCEEPVNIYPSFWDESLQLEYGLRGVCPAHCPDHEFAYDREFREHRCVVCDESAPADYYSDDY